MIKRASPEYAAKFSQQTGKFFAVEYYLGRKVRHVAGIGEIARMKEGFGIRIRSRCGVPYCKHTVTFYARPGVHRGAFAYAFDYEGNRFGDLRNISPVCKEHQTKG